MPVKFYCPKCNKRWIEWGAEKMGYKCPEEGCNGAKLHRVGADLNEETEAARPSLKRNKKVEAAPAGEEKASLGTSDAEDLLGFSSEGEEDGSETESADLDD